MCSAGREPLYDVMSNSRQTMSNICGNVFYQDASSLLTVWQQEDSLMSVTLFQIQNPGHEQLQLLESCLKPAGSDFKGDHAVNPVSKRDWFRGLTVLSEVVTLGAWSPLLRTSSTWLQSIRNLEPILVKYLLNLVVPFGSDAALSNSRPRSGESAKPVNLKEALNELQEDDIVNATSDLCDRQVADESSGDDSDNADAADLDLDTDLRK